MVINYFLCAFHDQAYEAKTKRACTVRNFLYDQLFIYAKTKGKNWDPSQENSSKQGAGVQTEDILKDVNFFFNHKLEFLTVKKVLEACANYDRHFFVEGAANAHEWVQENLVYLSELNKIPGVSIQLTYVVGVNSLYWPSISKLFYAFEEEKIHLPVNFVLADTGYAEQQKFDFSNDAEICENVKKHGSSVFYLGEIKHDWLDAESLHHEKSLARKCYREVWIQERLEPWLKASLA